MVVWLLATLVVFAALVLPTEQTPSTSVIATKSQCHRASTDAKLFPGALQPSCPLGDRIFDEQLGQYAFGRWKTPVNDLTFHVDRDWKLHLTTLFEIKNWDYRSIDTKDFFIGAAVVRLGYADDAFLYVVDKRTPQFEKFEWTGRLPGDLGVTFGGSSIDDNACTSFQLIKNQVSFCHDAQRGGWTIRAQVTGKGAISHTKKRVIIDAFMQQQEALTVLFPLGNDTMRPAYVHKGAGSPVTGTMTFGDEQVDLQQADALGAIDWTRSMALRCTWWKWASSNFRATVTTTSAEGQVLKSEQATVGINFSHDVYDIDGESQENAIWINGQVHVLRGVVFSVPDQPLQDKWLIKTRPGVQTELVQLQFTPKGSREDHTKMLVVESDFVQPYGYFDGFISLSSPEGHQVQVEVQSAFGVVENHFALW